MGISSQVLSIYKADVSDHLNGLKKLKGAERELAEEQIKATEQRKEQLESWAKGLAKVAVGVAAFAGVAKLAFDGYKDSVEEARLRSQALNIDLDKLDEAFGTLTDDMDVYRFAATLNHSALKITEKDMDNAAHAIRGMHRAGIDLKEATDAVTQALTTGRTRALEPYGIMVDETASKTDKFGNKLAGTAAKSAVAHEALDQLVQKYGQFDGAVKTTDESVEASQQNLSRAFDDLKKSLGGLVVAMRPLIDVLAEAAKGWTILIEKASELPAWAGDKLYDLVHGGSIEKTRGDLDYNQRLQKALKESSPANPLSLSIVAEAEEHESKKFYDELIALRKKQLDQFAAFEANGGVGVASYNVNRLSAATVSKEEAAARYAAMSPTERAAAAKAALELAAQAILKSVSVSNSNAASRVSVEHDLSTNIAGKFGLGVAADSSGADLTGKTDIDRAMERLNADAARAAQQAALAKQQQGESFLSRMFGKKEEFDAYHDLFQGLTSVVTSAYDAWIDGSMSAGEAVKATVKTVLKSFGERMLIRSIEEFAEGVASLALGPIGGASASQHFAASALFASGAAAAGIAAKSLSGGSASASSAGSGSGSGAIKSAGNDNQRQSVTYYIVGDPGGDNSPRQQQANFQRVQQRAEGATGVRFR